jgi:hypothetical protein
MTLDVRGQGAEPASGDSGEQRCRERRKDPSASQRVAMTEMLGCRARRSREELLWGDYEGYGVLTV